MTMAFGMGFEFALSYTVPLTMAPHDNVIVAANRANTFNAFPRDSFSRLIVAKNEPIQA
jgi:hypothetical protein